MEVASYSESAQRSGNRSLPQQELCRSVYGVSHPRQVLFNKCKTGDKAGNVIEKSPGRDTKLETGKDGTEVTNDWVQLLIPDGIMCVHGWTRRR